MTRLKIVTPEGIAVWPRLNEPDREFDSAGLFHVKLRISGKEAEGFMGHVTTFRDEQYASFCSQKGKKKLEQNPLPWKEDEENPGDFLISFKLKAKITSRNGDSWEQRPTILDAQLKPTTANIGGGSKLKISTEVNPYCTPSGTTGVTLWCKAVQVLDLVEYGGGGDHGFTATSGFSSEEDLVSESGDAAAF
jgi:hypothetical protein